MKNLKQFYDTLNKGIPFNNLSLESLDILEQSKAYKRYLKTNKNEKNTRRGVEELFYFPVKMGDFNIYVSHLFMGSFW